jgi:DNA-binding transcriptional regulator YiaG
MEKLADLYDVPVTELLDEYNLFLYGNQGQKIRTQRISLGMTREQYAKALGVPVGTLKKWEGNRVRIAKDTWKKSFS